MQKRRTAMAAAICTLVLICVFAGTFFFSSMSYQTDRFKVTLPSQKESTEDLSGSVVDDQPVNEIDLPELTPQNVQSVIASLVRPAQYSCAVVNTLYLDEGHTYSWQATSYVKNGAQRIERAEAIGDVTEIHLYYGDQVYVWEVGDANYWNASSGSITADMTAMIPSYRDVCTMPVESITHTELVDENGEPCILVECDGDMAEYLISMVDGLLRNVKYYENGELVREVTVSAFEEEIADSFFILPGGETPVYSAQN